MARKRKFADEAKTIMKKYEPRLGPKFDQGDTLALEAMNQELRGLQREQEIARVAELVKKGNEEQLAVSKFKNGDTLNKKEQASLSDVLDKANAQQAPQPQQQQGVPQGLPQQAQGGNLPKYPHGGYHPPQQTPYGNQAYTQGQYAGNAFLDYTPQMLQDPRFARPYEQYGLIGGRSPLDPLQRGAQGYPQQQIPQRQQGYDATARPGYAGGPASLSPVFYPQRGQGQSQGVDAYTGPDVPATAPGDRVYQGGEIPGYTITGQRPQGATGSGGSGGGGAPPQGGPGAGGGQGNLPAISTVDPYTDPNIQFDPLDFSTPQDTSLPPGVQENRDQQGVGSELLNPYQFRAPWFGAAASGIGSILGNKQLELSALEGVEDLEAQQVSPNLVDYSRGREHTKSQRDLTQAEIRGSTRGARTAQEVRAATRAGSTAAQRVAGSELNRSVEGQANTNAQIRNQVGMFNAQQRAQTGQMNLRTALLRGQYGRENQLINANRRTNQIAGVTGAISGYGRDVLSANYATGSLRLNEDPEFPIQQQNDTWLKRFLRADADPYKKYTGPNRPV